MRISTIFDLSRPFAAAADDIVAMEQAGLDQVLVPEAYGFDAISAIGALAGRTSTLELATGIINVYSRTPALVAMTAAGCDHVSNGRFTLGLGASGPQVVEGFHGVPYDRPTARIADYIAVCRAVWRREAPLEHRGTVSAPLPPGQGRGLGKPLKLIQHPVRPDIPIWWASIRDRSVRLTAELADGWFPAFFLPEEAEAVWGDALRAGAAERAVDRRPLDLVAGGMVAIGDDLVGDVRDAILDRGRPQLALYVGGMGARSINFYNELCSRNGFEAEAEAIQDHFLAGRRAEAEAAVPKAMLEAIHMVGPRGHVEERVAAYRDAGVTYLKAEPVRDPARTIAELKAIVG